MDKFVHLHTHSHYSLLDGLSKIDQLVDRAKELGMEALAITDHGNLYGSVEFFKKATKAGIKPIIGLEAYVATRSRHDKESGIDSTRYHLTLLVKNEIGYKNLVQLVTKSHLEGFYYKPRIDKELLEKYHEGLICLSGCFTSELSRAIEHGDMRKAKEVASFYKKLFGDDYYIEIQPQSPELVEGQIKIAEELGIPMVATQDSHYISKSDAPTHEVLLAIQTGNKLDDEDRFSFSGSDSSFRSEEEMQAALEEAGVDEKHAKEAIHNTALVADKCDFQFKLGVLHLPKFKLPEGERDSFTYLKELVDAGIKKRIGKETKEVRERADHELAIIQKTGFSDYFLIVQDMVNWAKSRGIMVGPGRGSAAGSLVSYVLNITDVNPLKYDLLFERFLNPERNEPPDIDLDFADHRREEVIGYLRETYGDDHVAQIITFGTMAARQAIRDAGRAMGLPYPFCDKIAKLIPFNPNQGRPKSEIQTYIEQVPELGALYRQDPNAKALLDTASNLEGVARHASVHACGTVVTQEPITQYLALQRAPQDENSIITQLEMGSILDMGLLKIDVLGLRNLSIMEDTLRFIKELEGKDLKISEIPLDDEETYKFLQEAETIGIFQYESSGMRRYMKDIKPHELEDLIALVALYRPGPMELIPSYIKRKFGKEKVEHIHPKLEPILKNTYGIGIYQEQMMRIATDLAGYTLPEADTLRKAIGKKIKTLLDAQGDKMIKGMVANGIDEKTAKKIWDLFPPFARYGFPRAHAVSYALIGYWTAYLKTRYPEEFMTSLLNHAGNDVERVAVFIQEAERMGIKVFPPDINKSVTDFAPEGNNIRFGLSAIKNVGSAITENIVDERLKNGPFESLADFALRTRAHNLNKRVLESLIKSGALDSLGVDRATALENMDYLLKSSSEGQSNNQNGLFGGVHKFEIKLKPAEHKAKKADLLAWEKELLGLYVTEHPLKEILKDVNSDKVHPIKSAFGENKEGKRIMTCGVITQVKNIVTKNGSVMAFAKIEDLSDTIEVLVFADTLAKTKDLWKENKAIYVTGRVSNRDGEAKIICESAKEINL
ncbi:MAG: polymerase III, alpha subunit protein [Parcubacteria group bacterium GW2011_GWA1_47_11]|nr:MAG: polymerase III, alpha subunit protein [Parcubacteria group bacterium GW2011_GWA1_47_11]